ncbi:hypothetical protein OESDEN_00197 [Oesophagostomum dentatum]|uniref:Uncharacterized protein n=1 Tax=Oesophagostomum dentatum TaxID=61180 RepID=A0A0B1TUI4_OESDE|nr:hypothetical protein OESDEN_00197 [Oesophagostomum dentatum]
MQFFCYAILPFSAIVMAYSSESDDHGWETLQIIPHVSGLRVENPIGEKGFIGYTWDTFILVKVRAERDRDSVTKMIKDAIPEKQWSWSLNLMSR